MARNHSCVRDSGYRLVSWSRAIEVSVIEVSVIAATPCGQGLQLSPVLAGVADAPGEDPPEPGRPALHCAFLEFVEVEMHSAVQAAIRLRVQIPDRAGGDVGTLGLLQRDFVYLPGLLGDG